MLYQIALEKYKKLHNVILINKFNRDQIHKKLKTKLALDYIQNLDFFTTSPHDCTRHIFYCLNLAQISCALTFEETCKLLNEAYSQLLILLPISLDQIDQSIKEILPFPLLIEDRKYTRAIVLALYKIYTFDQLNDNYFVNPIIPLSDNSDDLNVETHTMFLITSQFELSYLAEYRQKLCKYYNFEHIPSNYFTYYLLRNYYH